MSLRRNYKYYVSMPQTFAATARIWKILFSGIHRYACISFRKLQDIMQASKLMFCLQFRISATLSWLIDSYHLQNLLKTAENKPASLVLFLHEIGWKNFKDDKKVITLQLEKYTKQSFHILEGCLCSLESKCKPTLHILKYARYVMLRNRANIFFHKQNGFSIIA